MLEQLKELGDILTWMLFKKPWLIPIYLVGLWFLIIRPFTVKKDDEIREQSIQNYQDSERTILKKSKYQLHQFMEQTHQAYLAGKALTVLPDSQKEAQDHADVEAYISYSISLGLCPFTTFEEICQFTKQPFAPDEFSIDYMRKKWLLTNKNLYVISDAHGRPIHKTFQLSKFDTYEVIAKNKDVRTYEIRMNDGTSSTFDATVMPRMSKIEAVKQLNNS